MTQMVTPETGSSGEPVTPRRKEAVVLKSLIIDITLWIPDIILAVLSGSVTLYADVIKSGNEILSTFFTWLALRKMAEGESQIYDYGMGKFENLTGMITGAVMFLSLIFVFSITIFKLLNPSMLHEEATEFAVVMMGIGFLVNTWLYREKKHIADKEYSPAMESQMRLFKTKAITDLAVLIALLIVMITREYWWSIYIDPIASFVVIGFFLYSGYRIIASSLPDLLDKTLDEELQLIIVRALSEFFDDYIALHGVRSRRSGNQIYIEIFLEFEGERKMADVQTIINRMKTSLEKEIPKSSVTIVPSSE
ncbi:MAG: cation transporter [Methanomicrobiales archaeon HGW-Methanomicrobiales-4]|nr:MAG: cation transporter [Methanomicrobiales archaeon HGW-Methanomicrobiales-4]